MIMDKSIRGLSSVRNASSYEIKVTTDVRTEAQ